MKNTITSKQACTIAHQIRRETGCSLADAFKAAYAGNNTVAPKTSWSAEELNKIFSDKTAELLRKGYVIDLTGMNGHQGEIGKVTFKKNSNYYILIMESKTVFDDGKYNDHYIIRFGKYTEDTKGMQALNTWNTLWIDKFDTTWSMEVVKISNNYFVTVEEAKVINEKWSARVNNKYTKSMVVDSKYHKVVLPLVRKQKGYKALKLSNITKVTRVIDTDFSGKKVLGRHYVVFTDKLDKNNRPVILNVRF